MPPWSGVWLATGIRVAIAVGRQLEELHADLFLNKLTLRVVSTISQLRKSRAAMLGPGLSPERSAMRIRRSVMVRFTTFKKFAGKPCRHIMD